MDKLKYEKSLWNQGNMVVAGVDEVGRGCYAGPLVSAAVAWSPEILGWEKSQPEKYEKLLIINDSKKLSEKKRNLLDKFIKNNALDYSIYEVGNTTIDKIGVGKVNKIALVKAGLSIKAIDHLLVDHFDLSILLGKHKNREDEFVKQTSIIKGDSSSISIAAASIIAKVYRDNLMKNKYHEKYPVYGFDTNVGYGTQKHRDAIQKNGLSEIHRKSYNI